jgi:uncharacterized oligopeptide transporter (OPT) family protein
MWENIVFRFSFSVLASVLLYFVLTVPLVVGFLYDRSSLSWVFFAWGILIPFAIASLIAWHLRVWISTTWVQRVVMIVVALASPTAVLFAL